MLSRSSTFALYLGGLVVVNAQRATQTVDAGNILPAQSTALSIALSTFEAGVTNAAVFPTIAAELASASADPLDLIGLAGDAIVNAGAGGASFSAEVASVLSEYPPDVSSWWVSLTAAENAVVTSVLGTTAFPTADVSDLTGTDTGTGTDMGTMTSMTTGPSATESGGSKTTSSTGSGVSKSSSSASGTGSKNAGPTLGAMSGAACGVVAFGAAACAIGMM